MMQHSPEQEEMRAFPGPLAKYVLTDFSKKISLLYFILSSKFLLSCKCRLRNLN